MAAAKPPDIHGSGAGRSFAAVVANGSPDAVCDEGIGEVSLYRGEPSLRLSRQDMCALAAPYRNALVGRFAAARPSMEVVRKFFVSLGLKGECDVGLLDQRHILIRPALEEDYTRLFLRRVWFVNNAPMVISKWTMDFKTNQEPSIVPIWVAFPGLPIFFFAKNLVTKLAATLGRVLKIDSATSTLRRPSVARVLVEMDVSKEPAKRVWIGDDDYGFWQPVEVENWPLFCHFCDRVGHKEEECFKKNPALKLAGEKRTNLQQHGMRDSRQAYRVKERDITKEHTAELPGNTSTINAAKPPNGNNLTETKDTAEALTSSSDVRVVGSAALVQRTDENGLVTAGRSEPPSGNKLIEFKDKPEDSTSDSGVQMVDAFVQFATGQGLVAEGRPELVSLPGGMSAGGQQTAQEEGADGGGSKAKRCGQHVQTATRALLAVDDGQILSSKDEEVAEAMQAVGEITVLLPLSVVEQRDTGAHIEVVEGTYGKSNQPSAALFGSRGSVSEGEDEEITEQEDARGVGDGSSREDTLLRLHIDQSKVMDNGGKRARKKGLAPSDRQLRSTVTHSHNALQSLSHD